MVKSKCCAKKGEMKWRRCVASFAASLLLLSIFYSLVRAWGSNEPTDERARERPFSTDRGYDLRAKNSNIILSVFLWIFKRTQYTLDDDNGNDVTSFPPPPGLTYLT